MTLNEAEYFEFPQVNLDVDDFPADGWILDIGGGGERVIGRLKGRDVVAIDLLESELLEAAEGPLKMVMDARQMKFLNASFSAVTAFFSLMYVRACDDQQKIFNEVYRVLKPGGMMLVWDVNIPERSPVDQKIFVVLLKYRINGMDFETGYGNPWPAEPRGECDYLRLAQQAGFRVKGVERTRHVFQLTLEKPQAETCGLL